MNTIKDNHSGHWVEPAPTYPPRELVTKEWSFREKLLLPIALLIAILFDRLLIATMPRELWNNGIHGAKAFPAVFWLCYLIIVYSFYWHRLKKDAVAWFVALCAALLCLWNFVSSGQNSEFSFITFFVIPAVLMAHAIWTTGGYTLKNSEGMIAAWFEGWTVKPFSGVASLFGVTGSLLSKSNKPMLKRVLIGTAAALAVMPIIIPLLMGADQIFNYHLTHMFSNISFFRIFFHTITIVIAFGLFYSFLWNIGFGQTKKYGIPKTWSIDIIISSIVLGSVIALYAIFCIIQFTYLFAGAGLPAGMTYAEYAREGFAQTVTVCAINLLIFGIFIRLGKHSRLLKILLGGLLALTAIMLISGAVRLNLYIDTFGLTWLRLLSAWFIVYLAAVIILCTTRLLTKKHIPIVAICALLLLIWYTALGYLNPDNFIEWHNISTGAILPQTPIPPTPQPIIQSIDLRV
jgi:hypothetical protein